jgi:O-antigen/teichoic acid export membrane protein
VLAVGSFSLLTQADVVLVKALFPAHEAGLYASASTAGKMILYLTAPLLLVMLPESVRRHALSAEGRSVVIRAALYTALIGGTGAALYLIVPAAVIRVFFGSQYLEAAPLLGFLGLGMLAYELALLGVYYCLGAGERGVLGWIATLAVLFPVLVVAIGKSLSAVALLVLILGTFTCVGVWWRLWPRLRGSGWRSTPRRTATEDIGGDPIRLQGVRDAAD